MKRFKILFFATITFSYYIFPLERGCIRTNSNEMIRDLLFMHIEQGHMNLVINLLDIDTLQLKSLAGQTIFEMLEKVKSEKKVDIQSVLAHVEKLEKIKYKTYPVPDLPD